MEFENYFVSDSFMKTLMPLYCKVGKNDIVDIVNFIISKTIRYAGINDFSMDGVLSFVESLIVKISVDYNVKSSDVVSYVNSLVFEMILKQLSVSDDDLNKDDISVKVSKYIIENIRLKNYKYCFNKCWDKGYIAIVREKAKSSNVDLLYKRYLSLNMSVKDIFNYCLVDCEVEDIDESNASLFIKLPNYDELHCKLVCDSIKGKLQILNDARIRITRDEKGNKKFVSTNGNNEVELVKNILCDEDVFNVILSSNDSVNDRWIPYFSGHILEKGENIVKIFKLKNLYFPYISFKRRNDVLLMRQCISGDVSISKDFIYLVGKDVLNDIDFLSLLIIKISDEDFDFYGESIDSISGSKMAYGKLIGKDVQRDEKFWNLLNSRIKLLNKKYALTIPLFDVSREIVIASRYFDSVVENG